MVEQVSYQLINKINDIEIRCYPELIVVSTVNESDNRSFGILFDYISGNNTSRKQIPMTSPVISSERIPMTSPVITKDNYMAFSLPNEYTIDTAPKPNDPSVSLEKIPKRTLAVLRFGGRISPPRFEKYSKLLKNELQENGIEISRDVFLLRYNSPFTPGFLRRNEVAIEIKEY